MLEDIKVGWKLDNSYTKLPETFFSNLKLNKVTSPKLIILNEELAESMGLNTQALKSEVAISIFAGNSIPEGGISIAQAYAGHQFGHFTMLGDGRAILLGENISPEGERLDIQLKGSGRTPYSRGGDGRASLGPMLREYIISEAMHGLGIPTTRSLAVVTTGEKVIRKTQEIGAIMTRIAKSHLRVGTFEYAANFCNENELKALADYTIKRHFSEINSDKNPYISLVKKVVEKQARLIAKWQHIGFIHGVMNTDNMTISGETIDYGPCAFMDVYDPKTVFSSIDRDSRYAYGNQPIIAKWNLARFTESLLPLIDDDREQAVQVAYDLISKFDEEYNKAWLGGMRSKLGLFNEKPEDKMLIEEFLNIMEDNKADYTNAFRALTIDNFESIDIFNKTEFKEWYKLWQKRLNEQNESHEESKKLMKQNNPSVIPRNHRVEDALYAAVVKNDYSVMEDLLEVLKDPYDYSELQEEYTTTSESSKSYRTFCGT